MAGCGQVVRLDSDRHQRRNQVKLSLLDLPFLPDELRELGSPRDPGGENHHVARGRDPNPPDPPLLG
jgi:hypothetical protein